MFVNDYSGGAPMLNAGTTSLKDGTWHHHAVVRGASGACAISLTALERVQQLLLVMLVAAQGTQYLGDWEQVVVTQKFFLDDFRVTRGVARYDPSQTSVTIPTSAFANR